jgi:hypothetical protein
VGGRVTVSLWADSEASGSFIVSVTSPWGQGLLHLQTLEGERNHIGSTLSIKKPWLGSNHLTSAWSLAQTSPMLEARVTGRCSLSPSYLAAVPSSLTFQKVGRGFLVG